MTTENKLCVMPTVEVSTPVKIAFDHTALLAQAEELSEKYSNLVITEATKSEAKEVSVQLTKTVKDLNAKRIEVKKLALAPITLFEDKIKEVIGVLTDCRNPIKERLDEFAESDRKEKETKVHTVVEAECNKLEFSLDLIDFDTKWYNASTTIKSIKDAVFSQIESHNRAEKLIQTTLKVVNKYIDMVNETRYLAIKADQYLPMIKEGIELDRIYEVIDSDANRLKAMASDPKEVVESVVGEVAKTTQTQPSDDEPKRKFTIELNLTKRQAQMLTSFMKTNNITFKKV